MSDVEFCLHSVYTPLCGVSCALAQFTDFYLLLRNARIHCLLLCTLESGVRGGQWPLKVSSYQFPCGWAITAEQLRWSEVTWQEERSRSHGYSDDVVPAMQWTGWIHIYGLLKQLRISPYSVIVRMGGEQWVRKCIEQSSRCLVWSNIPLFAWKDWRRPRKLYSGYPVSGPRLNLEPLEYEAGGLTTRPWKGWTSSSRKLCKKKSKAIPVTSCGGP
jgi:hypothetical protein